MRPKQQKGVNQLKIWDHQKDAVKIIAKYLTGPCDKSFLVKMPTGTGKTGVFATLTRIAEPGKNYLIVTPSAALKFQIIEELREKFWLKIDYDRSKLNVQVIDSLMPTNFEELLDIIRTQNFIVVTTIQALQRIAVNDALTEKYEVFKSIVNCIIFDEGHKEPAYTWGMTIRSFQKPTILFSATPYRNDYKVFNIDKENFYAINHEFCTEQNYLRELVIHEINEASKDVGRFLAELLGQIRKLQSELEAQDISNPKIIIRCENEDDIKKVVKGLKRLRRRVIGIHENFKVEAGFSNQVPTSSEQVGYDYFVHQFKLIEGIDNPDFCIVAIYSDFKNTRMLIQQIGRVLRNPKRLSNQKAYLFCKNKLIINEEWEKYLKYDKSFDKRQKLFDITDILKVNREVSTLYFDGTFRDLVDVDEIILKDSILFQKKVNVYKQYGEIEFIDLSYNLIEEWNARDFSILKEQFIENDTLLILYIKYENSPLVKHGVFIEQTLAITFLKFKGEFIYYYDSLQNSPMRQFESLKPLNRESLVKLFNDKRSINKVYLLNTDIGISSLRSKEIQAAAVEHSAPGLIDHSYFPSRMLASVYKNGSAEQRYIGFQNGRVTDYSNTRINFDEFLCWIDDIHTNVLAKRSENDMATFMNRYAMRVDPPESPEAISILLDLNEDDLTKYGFGEKKEDIDLTDACSPVINNTFDIKINGVIFSINIKYDSQNERFVLSSTELTDQVYNLIESDPSLLGYLNQSQAFRIVLKDNLYIYAHKYFFKPGLNLLKKKEGLDISQLFTVYNEISQIVSEKGNDNLQIENNLWHKDTLFGLIARQGKGYNNKNLERDFNFEFLLCDDLQTEIGDFIALDVTNRRLVFIHAKAKKAQISATSFTEVCGQAVKNLDYLSPYSFRTPQQNINKWKKSWSHKGIGVVKKRVIVGNCTPNQFWKKYSQLIFDPSTKREVWLVVGGMFDYDRFKSELNKNNVSDVKPEIVQLIFLLRSTWNNVNQVGANLRIFC